MFGADALCDVSARFFATYAGGYAVTPHVSQPAYVGERIAAWIGSDAVAGERDEVAVEAERQASTA